MDFLHKSINTFNLNTSFRCQLITECRANSFSPMSASAALARLNREDEEQASFEGPFGVFKPLPIEASSGRLTKT